MLFSASIVKYFIVRCPLRGDYRGHDIHHSGWEHKQGNSAWFREKSPMVKRGAVDDRSW